MKRIHREIRLPQIINLLKSGWNLKQIAAKFGISLSTVGADCKILRVRSNDFRKSMPSPRMKEAWELRAKHKLSYTKLGLALGGIGSANARVLVIEYQKRIKVFGK